MSKEQKSKTDTAVQFNEASGRNKAQASLEQYVNKQIDIRNYESEERQIKGRQAFITFITLSDGTVLYTWSDVVRRQLESISQALQQGKVVRATVIRKRGASGNYLALS